MKAAFVILHYRNVSDTIECVQSILQNIVDETYAIVIVDNFSNDGSFETLQKRFAATQQVHLVPASVNLGFAKGNNLGIDYAYATLGCELVVAINNDTLIEQPDFLSKIIQKYQKEPFHLLGPDILSIKHAIHQNPDARQGLTLVKIEKRIKSLQRDLFLRKIGIYAILVWYDHLKNKRQKGAEFKVPNRTFVAQELEHVVLHGSALVFSPLYLKQFKGFYSQTFMYCEEEILYFIADRENLRIIYWPDVQILHKEDAATDLLFASNQRKKVYKMKHVLTSLKLLKQLHQGTLDYHQDIDR